ncbi:MAG TPA: M23 family metallopeptidase [Thermoanaerobaculia bacterium]
MRNVLSGILVVLTIGLLIDLECGGHAAALTAPARPAHSTVLIPVEGVQPSQLKSTFNEGRAGHIHHAIDILAPRGTPVLAAVDGTVRKLFSSRAGGITLYEYDRAGERSYYYAHLDGYAPGIREGLDVHRGDVIGYVGTTGNAPESTPHLHFAIEILPPSKEWWKGEPIDPYPILTTPVSALP